MERNSNEAPIATCFPDALIAQRDGQQSLSVSRRFINDYKQLSSCRHRPQPCAEIAGNQGGLDGARP